MKVVTAEEMQDIDRETIHGLGMPGLVLMERAGLAVVSKIKEFFGRRRVIVVSGSGNNGGDGLVVARNLHNEGWDVRAFITSKPENLKGDALSQYKTASEFGVSIRPIEELLINYPSILIRHPLIVDAILGTGLKKEVTGLLSDVIRLINKSKVPVISVDMPSGISSDSGQIMGEAIKANYTVTFGLPKRGHILYPGCEYSGKLFIEDIGFPKDLLSSDKLKVELLEREYISAIVPERYKYSHKGDYGHVLIVAGSKGKTGAAFMTAKACLRSGAGLVTIGIPESLSDVFQTRVTEEMTLILPDKGDGTLSSKSFDSILYFLDEKADILAIGPGIGVSSHTEKLVKTLIQRSSKPMVIDADGINSIQKDIEIFSRAKAPIILTPHPGEMARLLSQKSKVRSQKSEEKRLRDKIEKDRINIAQSFSKETGTYLVLKGVPTIIATPDRRAFINTTGNPGMATGGTGDVLTGMISGFLSQNKDPLNACILGVYLHGIAGDIVATEKSQHSLIASDIIEKIPDVLCTFM
jgi:NAD(P)H-hydrate epimerase